MVEKKAETTPEEPSLGNKSKEESKKTSIQKSEDLKERNISPNGVEQKKKRGRPRNSKNRTNKKNSASIPRISSSKSHNSSLLTEAKPNFEF